MNHRIGPVAQPMSQPISLRTRLLQYIVLVTENLQYNAEERLAGSTHSSNPPSAKEQKLWWGY
jgi:hypothetical protein